MQKFGKTDFLIINFVNGYYQLQLNFKNFGSNDTLLKRLDTVLEVTA